MKNIYHFLCPLTLATFTFNTIFYKIKTHAIALLTLLFTVGFSDAFGQITTIPITTTGSGFWTAPCGVTSVTVEAWGAGGAGGGSTINSSKGGGGGAGGTYVSSIFTVIPGTTYNLYVAPTNTGTTNAGTKGQGSWFINNTTLFAEGGNGGAAPNNATVAGGVGSITLSIGSTITAGANGASGTTTIGGSGGNGGNGGGAGGIQRTTENDGANGSNVGGGGGGAFIPDPTNHLGGTGARGEIRITYTSAIPVDPGNPTSDSPQCNPPGVTLTRAGSPPVGVTWYWQTTALGTSTANSGATNVVTASGTYYIRAQNNATGCWSTGSGSLAITISTVPSAVTTPIPSNGATGICYAGAGPITNISWGAAAGATSYDVYFGAGSLPGTFTNVATNAYNTGALSANTTYYWRIVAKNACGDAVTSPIWSFTTSGAVCYCVPTVSNGYYQYNYIKEVSFVGNLTNPPTNNSTWSTAPQGYQDFTSLTKAAQAQGEGVNIFINTENTYGANYMKAWVDWNKNGIFETGEIVYQCTNSFINSTFGFQIPLATPPGDYRIRMRVIGSETGNNTFDACTSYANVDGETEDYLFTVVADCAAKILSKVDGSNCGSGTVTLSASGNAGTTSLNWYTAAGVFITNTPTAGTTASWTTPSITATTHYYVTALNGSCESLFKTLVTALINPVPTLTFSNANPEICGEDSIITLTATASDEQVYLINENFESGLGVFTNTQIASPNGALTNWQVKTSTYVPQYPIFPVWYPAISSGFGSDKFVISTSDITTGGTTAGKVNEALELISAVNTTGFVNLTMTFKIYFSSYYDSNNANTEGVFVEINSGSGWSAPIASYLGDEGIGTNFVTKTINLNAYTNVNSLKIRIRYRAGWCDGVAIDEIKLFGERPFAPSFTWVPSNPIGFYSDAAATNPYLGTPASIVYIKPSITQIESYENWNVQATATLSNGCSAVGNISIVNNTKIWQAGTNDWNTANWLPNAAVPTSNQCVIIRKPVVLGAGPEGFAKKVKVEIGGKLTINPDQALTVTDAFINQATEADVIIASDANLKQITDSPVPSNSGSVTAKRNIKFRNTSRAEYNYLISPVVGQSLKTIYPGVPTTSTYPYVLYYNEATNYFGNSTGAYIAGRGLAVKEPKASDVPANNIDAVFKGAPANGVISLPLAFTDNTLHGYNLVGNPYPSNIDLQLLYVLNGGTLTPNPPATGKITSTFYFWDNAANIDYQQQGSAYSGRAYAVFNAYNNTGNAAGHLLTPAQTLGAQVPNKIAKTGQGFMVRGTASGNSLMFNNSIRVTANTGAGFFSKPADSMADRYWIQLITPTNLVNSIAVVHFEGGAAAFGMDDSEHNVSSSDMFYSLTDNHKVQIEGRPAFVNTDKIFLGSAHFVSGNYTIALGHQEGIFANGQHIYLKDNQTGIITNLSGGGYTFAANAGVSTGRFEIIYKPETVLATDASTKEEVTVYRDADDFVVRAQSKKMTMIEVYDGSGRLIVTLQPNSTKAVLHTHTLNNGMYILRISQNGEFTTKKIMK